MAPMSCVSGLSVNRMCCHTPAALGVIRYFSTDGYNQLGDLTPDGGLINGNPYNRWNYSVSHLVPFYLQPWRQSLLKSQGLVKDLAPTSNSMYQGSACSILDCAGHAQ